MAQVKVHSLFTEFDINLFKSGKHYRLYEKMGSHLVTVDGIDGVYFAVWAPTAKQVSVIGDFNYWMEGEHQLNVRWDSSGIWEGFIPLVEKGATYKYKIQSNNNDIKTEKADPYARRYEHNPKTASIVWDDDYNWKDKDWMKTRKKHNAIDAPYSVYEVHLGSWKKQVEEDRFMSYFELADDLVTYVKDMNFTHVELMPIMEFPYDPSWGYQVTGYFAPTSRFGYPEEFKYLVDKLHQAGIGIILDWVPSHFPWEPNMYGGRENLAVISFLKELNEEIYSSFPDVQTIAEESTAFPMVSRPTFSGGLGFGMKWMMGWMHDTLDYFSKDPVYRKHHHNEITFSLAYAFTENFMLPLSHDEVVYGKNSILGRMPGDEWQRFANLRLLYGYMFTHPGTKLLFMGGEFGQYNEWNFQESLDWNLLEHKPHIDMQHYYKSLNAIYRSTPALYEKGFSHEGFEWISHDDHENSVISYIRKGYEDTGNVVVICNLTPAQRLFLIIVYM